MSSKPAQSSGKLICPTCGTSNAAGAMVCRNCEQPLVKLGGMDTRTTILPDELLSESDELTWSSGGARIPGSVIHISVERSNKPIKREVNEDGFIIGRESSQESLRESDINLYEFNGLERGVSRRHLRLFLKEGELYVEDLNSSNGTTHNGRRLTPYHPASVRDGAELMLGRMLVWINF